MWVFYSAPPKKKPIRNTPSTAQEILQSIQREPPKKITCPPAFLSYCLSAANADDVAADEDKEEPNKYKKTAFNANVDDIFYNPDLFTQAVMNSTENVSRSFVRKWLRRKLHCQVGEYSIWMTYNPRRMAFQYASNYTVPYDVLNQAAMNYVTQFRCLHLFQDTMACPEFRSPLIDLYGQYTFLKDQEIKEETSHRADYHISRSAMLEKSRREKQKPAGPPPVYVPEQKHLNSFYKMRPIQEEWNESIRIYKGEV
jgi:hypothetical protein